MILFDIVRIQTKHLWIVGMTILLMIFTHIVLNHTKIGKAMRAVSDSPELAKLTGINTEHVIQFTWVMAAILGNGGGCICGD